MFTRFTQANLPTNFPNSASLMDILRYRSVEQANKIALTFLDDEYSASHNLTYQELDFKARAIAAYLQSLNATDERILLLYPSGLDFVCAFFGCLYASAIAVPVHPPSGKRRLPRLQAIVQDAGARFALTNKSVMAKLSSSFQEEPLKSLQCITTNNLTYDADEWVLPEIEASSLAFLQYTSGSTGTPKGVMVTHKNLLYNLASIETSYEHTPDSKGVSWLPLYHDMGLVGGVLQPVYAGFPITLLSPKTFLLNPFLWLKTISDCQATTSGAPNFAYDLCVDKITPEQRTQLDLSSWEIAFTGAELIQAETIERFSATFAECGFKKNAFYPCYGLAEATLNVSGGLKTEPPVIRYVNNAELKQDRVVVVNREEDSAKAIVGVGKSWLKQKIAIADPELLTECQDGKIGEIWVSSPSVTNGYWRKPEETKQAFEACLADTNEGPFLRTGDLGFLLDGELFVTGRLKDLIIIRGQNHYPQDIETTVQNSHRGLRPNCGAAFSLEVDGREQLVIVQEVERSYLHKITRGQLDADEIIRTISQAVADEHQVQVYAIALLRTGSIFKTSSGKIQRHACRASFLDKSLKVVADWQISFPSSDDLQSQTEPGSPKRVFSKKEIETKLINELARHLEISPDEIDIRESFFAYGLVSYIALDMIAKLSEWIGRELELTLLWEYRTIETLAQHLAE